MSDAYHTAERLQLLARGYHILPNVDKMCVRPGWADPDYVLRELTDNAKRTAAQRIERWPAVYPDFKATGVRLEDGLAVIDADVDNLDGITNAGYIIGEIAPEVYDRAPMRFGAGEKFALFCRVAEPFGRIVSHAWRVSADKDDTHQVEIYGGKKTPKGKCSRQFGIYGPHSHDENGEPLRYYEWDEKNPNAPPLHETDFADLPLLTETQALAIVNGFDRWAEEAGWIRVAKVGANASNFLFDITDETRFDTMQRGSNLTYEELCEAYDGLGLGGELRCSTSFLAADRDARRPDHCKVSFCDRYQCVGVYVFGDEAWHLPADHAPPDPAKLTEALRQVQPMPVETADYEGPPRPGDDTELGEKVAWLLAMYAYCAPEDRVVELYEPSDSCHMRLRSFQVLFRAWFEETIGPRKGVQRAYATGGWELNAHRLNVRGVQMRPDQPFPVFKDVTGRTFKNTYRRPVHTGQGDIKMWLAFMEHLLPDPIERAWFTKALAHKYRNPGIPGVAIIMVAAGVYGAGRGFLRDIVARLFGPSYVKPVDFDVFSGTSAQGVYTDWAAYSVVVTVTEARDTPDSTRWSGRRAVYERLKELVDPRAVERTFTSKGKPAFTAPAFASYMIFSNNRDALQLPADDRRVTALANGKKMPPEMAAELTDWINQPGNIAELARWLEAVDLAGFNAYEPLRTRTKDVMQELARSDKELAVDEVMQVIGPRGFCTMKAAIEAAIAELNDYSDPTRRVVTQLLRGRLGLVHVDGTRVRMSTAGRPWVVTPHEHDTASYVTDTTQVRLAAARTDQRLAAVDRGQAVDTGRGQPENPIET